ncbi:unnamed protein product, partial [Oncorhynchus mykiss]
LFLTLFVSLKHWTRHGSFCYFVGPEIKTFDEAKETCKSSQSYLADVSSRLDNAFLISLVGSRPEQHFWIGLSNQNHIDFFSWTNSNRVRYTHWNAQMPGKGQPQRYIIILYIVVTDARYRTTYEIYNNTIYCSDRCQVKDNDGDI